MTDIEQKKETTIDVEKKKEITVQLEDFKP